MWDRFHLHIQMAFPLTFWKSLAQCVLSKNISTNSIEGKRKIMGVGASSGEGAGRERVSRTQVIEQGVCGLTGSVI